GAQLGDHRLIVGDTILVEHGDDYGPGRSARVALADQSERRLQTRDTNGEAGRRHRLATQARYQTVITTTAANRAEPHRAALCVIGLEQQFNLVNGAGVILEAADDRLIDADPIAIAGGTDKF